MGRSTAWLAALTVTMLGAAHVLGGHPQAQADCEPPTLKEAAADANAVFVGTTVQQVAGGTPSKSAPATSTRAHLVRSST